MKFITRSVILSGFLLVFYTFGHSVIGGVAIAGSDATPGSLISFEPVQVITQKAIDLNKRILFQNQKLKDMATKAGLFPSKAGVLIFKFLYSTTGEDGNPSYASAAFMVPDSTPSAPMSLLSYQHSTALLKSNVPSQSKNNLEATALALVFASMQVAVVAPDYLGLGDSPGRHPYLHAKSEASASRDALIAASILSKKLGYDLNKKLYLLGHSQGAHATLALHKNIEKIGLTDFELKGSAAVAGPYNLMGLLQASMRSGQNNSGAPTVFATYLFYSMIRAHQLGPLADFFNPTAATQIPDLFDGHHSISDIAGALPNSIEDSLTKKFQEDIKTRNAVGFLNTLTINSVGNFAPKAPVVLFHSEKDKTIPIVMSEKTHDHMKALGGNVYFLNLGNELAHGPSLLPALILTYEAIIKF